MTIGERIKTLRHQRDITQEKLADYLNVSCQAVSKWECGLNSPDLSLIAPLTRLLKVSADELLGLTPEISDKRRQLFDEAEQDYWKKENREEIYELARQAVEEYPDDFRYLMWLADMEFYTAYDEDYLSGKSKEHYTRQLESAVRHCRIIIENCSEGESRRRAIAAIVLNLTNLGRSEEARQYAELYPRNEQYSYDDVLANCLSGDELLLHEQNMIHQSLAQLVRHINNLWQTHAVDNTRDIAAMEACEGIIRAIIPDGNTLEFSNTLSIIYLQRAKIAVSAGQDEQAVTYLREAKLYAAESDRISRGGPNHYTCPLFDHIERDWSDEHWNDLSIRVWHQEADHSRFDPLRIREDFQQLISE